MNGGVYKMFFFEAPKEIKEFLFFMAMVTAFLWAAAGGIFLCGWIMEKIFGD